MFITIEKQNKPMHSKSIVGATGRSLKKKILPGSLRWIGEDLVIRQVPAIETTDFVERDGSHA